MAKELVKGAIGTDGSYKLVVADGELQATLGYKVAAVLAPVKKNFVDKLKALIPGTWDDALIDKAWDESVKYLSE